MLAATLATENMTVCGPDDGCNSDCKTYRLPLSTCFSPPALFPGDPQWGTSDVFDVCTKTHLHRTFYASADGSCTNKTDSFTVPLNECVGPFGKPRPWGSFACSPPPPPQEEAGLAPGDHTITVRATNDTIIHVPTHYDPSKPVPVLLAMHGLGANYPVDFQRSMTMDAVADNETFAVVYPLGSKSISVTLFGHTWNSGKCCFSHANDTAFLLQVVEEVGKLLTVDRTRVYAMGFSAGGVMSHALGCAAADTFAAIASMDGPFEVEGECTPSRPMPVQHWHGTLDEVFPYPGTPIYNGAPQTFAAWQSVDMCKDEPTNSTQSRRVTLHTSTECTASEVQLATIHGGTHVLPPKKSGWEQFMWDFLKRWKIESPPSQVEAVSVSWV